jgi:hypothetical protein
MRRSFKKTVKVTWFAYPHKSPPQSGYYLVTRPHPFKDTQVEVLQWSLTSKCFFNGMSKRTNILAWAKLPEPFTTAA